MLCTVKPVQAGFFNHSSCDVASWLGRKPRYVHAVGSNSLETTYILFELPYRTSAEKLCDWPGQWPGKVDHH